MIVKLEPIVKVDLYAATGFAVGTSLAVTNVSGADVKLFSTASEPTVNDDFFPCIFNDTVVSDAGDSGAWAQCMTYGAIDVSEVV